MHTLRSLARVGPRRTAVVMGVVAATIAATATPAFAASIPLTLSALKGPSGGGNTITATVTTGVFQLGTAVIFQQKTTDSTACPVTYTSTGNTVVTPDKLKRPSTKLLGITVPSGVVTGVAAVAKFNICVYSGTAASSPLIAHTAAAAPYAVSAAATITGVTPAAGAAQGGTSITVLGSNFPDTLGTAAAPNITATVAGKPLTITSTSATSFTATTPANAPGGPYAIAVTTAGGTVTVPNLFSYANGIVVTPNSAPNTSAAVDLDVQGVGFSSMTFPGTTGTTPKAASGHVYLVAGVYSAAGSPKANPGKAECVNVLPISDVELICTLQLRARLVAAENAVDLVAATTGLAASAASNASANITLTTGNFALTDGGRRVTGTGLSAGTTLSTVGSTTTGTLSQVPTGAISGMSVGASGTFADGVVLSATPQTLTSATAKFTASDVGKLVIGTGAGTVPFGTTITAVTNATTATLSVPVAASGALSFTIDEPVPVTTGVYTVTLVNTGAANGPAGLTQSVISSGSTFTVADF
jgi:hypothetical protein